MTTKTWSKYQERVFEFILSGTGNGLVEAMPGSGKTTVIEECVARIPLDKTILLLAFNRHIRDELKKRMEHLPNVTVHTINSFGNSVVRANLGYRKVNINKVVNILKFDYFEMKRYDAKKFAIWARCAGFVQRVISLAKANMVFDLTQFEQQYQSIIDQYDLEEPDLSETSYDLEHMLFSVFNWDAEKEGVIDFDDQIYLPVKDNMVIEQYDYVCVDEAQDLSPVQIEFTRRAISERSLYVGDRRQAIYQFRGADSKAMDNIQVTLDSELMPLSICYRCSKAVVQAAQRIVPGIETFDGAIEGSENNIDEPTFRQEVHDGDVVLCRTTAPLVKECFGFIRDGRKATVKGRDIGKDIKDLIKKLSEDNGMMPIEEFDVVLGAWYSKLRDKYTKMKRDTSLIILEDKLQTIQALCEHSSAVCDLHVAIDSIFENGDDSGILMMTIHKAKGLEAPRIFILRPDQLPHKLAKSEEAIHAEENLKFVAITRTQEDLFWVHPPADSAV